jgi:hypothetical protein
MPFSLFSFDSSNFCSAILRSDSLMDVLAVSVSTWEDDDAHTLLRLASLVVEVETATLELFSMVLRHET